jgi:chloramphenicol-sensitive protein RarD
MQHSVNNKFSNLGFFYGLFAFSIWGFFPIYFKSVSSVDPLEVLAHRIIWSQLILLILLVAMGRINTFIQQLRSPSKWMPLALTALLISINWLVFIWSVAHDHILDSSLGYFINPLFSVVLGLIFLKETLRPIQWLAVFIVSIAIIWKMIQLGHMPYIALTLAFSFGSYGLLRKKIVVDPFTGLAIETFLLSPIALGYLIWLGSQGKMAFLHQSIQIDGLLIFAGVLTTLPLILFAAAAKNLSLISLGIMQYIVPTTSFLIAVFYYHEPFGRHQLVTFALIWIAVIVFTAESIFYQKKIRAAVTPPT